MSGCSNIVQCPEIFGDIKNLWIHGTAIVEVPSSIAVLTQLTSLSLDFCKQLSSLPSSICKLKSLERLSLFGCCNLESFPKIMEPMEFLTDLDIGGTAVAELPSSIAVLTQLTTLRMISCKQLSSLPSSICKLKSLKRLDLFGCCNLEIFPEIMEPMEFLTSLNLGETAIAELPSSIQLLPCLKDLYLYSTPIRELPSSVKHLKSLNILELQGTPVTYLPELPPCLQYLKACDCESLETIPSNNHETNFKRLNFANCFKLDQKAFMAALQHKFQSGQLRNIDLFILAGCEIPEWFSDQCVGHSITMRWPVNSHQPQGICFALVFAMSDLSNDLREEFLADVFGVEFFYRAKNNNGGHKDYLRCRGFEHMKSCEGDHMLLWYENIISVLSLDRYSGNDVTFEFYTSSAIRFYSKIRKTKLLEILHPCEVKKCGVYPVF